MKKAITFCQNKECKNIDLYTFDDEYLKNWNRATLEKCRKCGKDNTMCILSSYQVPGFIFRCKNCNKKFICATSGFREHIKIAVFKAEFKEKGEYIHGSAGRV